MLSRWIYVLIGQNDTGKTTFQKKLIYHLCDEHYVRLDRNKVLDITHKLAPKKLTTLFLMSRSFQESKGDYKSIDNYFNNYFEPKDICVLSTHSNKECIEDIKTIISEGRKRKYNVGGVFFSNDTSGTTDDIALLSWDERFVLDNPPLKNSEKIEEQINLLAWEFAEMIVRRAYQQ